MQDEHFMRQWNAGHSRFSADIDKKLIPAARHLRQGLARLSGPKDPAGQCRESRLARQARLTGSAMLAGILAGAGLAAVAPLLLTLGCPETVRDGRNACVAAALA